MSYVSQCFVMLLVELCWKEKRLHLESLLIQQ